MNEEHLRPGFRSVATSIWGGLSTFIIFSVFSIAGIYLTQIFLRGGRSFFNSNPESWMGILFYLGMFLILTLYIHLPLRKATYIAIPLSLAVYIIVVIATLGFPENTMPLMIAAIGPLLFILAIIALIFRLLINKMGILGYIVCYFIVLSIAAFLFQ